MAFFGLTQIGYQDTIREHLKNPEMNPVHFYRSGLYRDNKLPPIENKERVEASIVPIDQMSGYGPGPDGSHKEFTRLRTKHTRNPQEIIDVYRRPVYTSADIANWRRDEPLRERQPWTYVKRYIRTNSEMTSFVHKMALTNREFSLY